MRGWSPTLAGSFILPMVIAHGVTSGLSGIVMAYFGRYTVVIRTGTALWAVGAGLKATYSHDTPIWIIVIVGVLEGIGVGCSLQPGELISSLNSFYHALILTMKFFQY